MGKGSHASEAYYGIRVRVWKNDGEGRGAGYMPTMIVVLRDKDANTRKG